MWIVRLALRRPYTFLVLAIVITLFGAFAIRSEEHTSELQSQSNLVCRLLLEKKYGRCVYIKPANCQRQRARRRSTQGKGNRVCCCNWRRRTGSGTYRSTRKATPHTASNTDI